MTVVEGTLNSTPNSVFRLEFFTNTACNPSGFGAGERFLGSTTVTTDGQCNASFGVTFHGVLPIGQFVTSTATDVDNNTSEFSRCLKRNTPLSNTDFNGDGHADLVWRHTQTGQVALWLLNGLSIQDYGSPGTVADLGWQLVAVADVDGDGKADLVWRHTQTGQVALWLLNGLTVQTYGSPGTVSDAGWQLVGSALSP